MDVLLGLVPEPGLKILEAWQVMLWKAEAGGRSYLGYVSASGVCLQALIKYSSVPFQIPHYGVQTMSGSGWSGQSKNMGFQTLTSYYSRTSTGRSCARWPKMTSRGSPRATTPTSFCRTCTTSERVRWSPPPRRALSEVLPNLRCRGFSPVTALTWFPLGSERMLRRWWLSQMWSEKWLLYNKQQSHL